MLTKSHFSSKNANSTLVSAKTFISSQATIAKSKLNHSLPLITVWARSSVWQSDWLLTSLSGVQSPLFCFLKKSSGSPPGPALFYSASRVFQYAQNVAQDFFGRLLAVYLENQVLLPVIVD